MVEKKRKKTKRKSVHKSKKKIKKVKRKVRRVKKRTQPKTQSSVTGKDFEVFEFGVQRLKELKKELGFLNTRGFSAEESSIRSKLKNVSDIPVIEREMKDLKSKIHGKYKPKKPRAVRVDSGVEFLVDRNFNDFLGDIKTALSKRIKNKEKAIGDKLKIDLKKKEQRFKDRYHSLADKEIEKRKIDLEEQIEKKKRELDKEKVRLEEQFKGGKIGFEKRKIELEKQIEKERTKLQKQSSEEEIGFEREKAQLKGQVEKDKSKLIGQTERDKEKLRGQIEKKKRELEKQFDKKYKIKIRTSLKKELSEKFDGEIKKKRIALKP